MAKEENKTQKIQIRQSNKPLILVTNDDGVDAKRSTFVSKHCSKFGRNISSSQRTTIRKKSCYYIYIAPAYQSDTCRKRFLIYKANNTPVDAVKLAQCVLLKDQKNRFIIGSINHGSNSSSSVFYSGAIAAAIEGCLNKIPSIGFSLADYSSSPHFRTAEKAAHTIIQAVLENKLPENICLNVNIPNIPLEEMKGYRITRQGLNRWQKNWKNVLTVGRPYYWLNGFLIETDDNEDTDEWALKNNYVSIHPIQTDLTAHSYINNEKWKF